MKHLHRWKNGEFIREKNSITVMVRYFLRFNIGGIARWLEN